MILQIETATAVCSVALAKDGEVVAEKRAGGRNLHAEAITLFIAEVMAAAGIAYNQLDAVAVSCGPGSYTGLRIGISVAKGLCFALDTPLIAIETLEAMAWGAITSGGVAQGDVLLCPMIDARRMEVYTAVFDTEGKKVRPTAAEIIDGDSFHDLLSSHRILFFGDGAEKCRAVLDHPNGSFLPGFTNSAVHLTRMASEKFRIKDFEDVAYFEPFYLKDFIAGKKAV